VLKVGEGSN